MKLKNLKKKFLAWMLIPVIAVSLVCGIPPFAASAKNGYYDGDMFEEVLNNPDETYKGLQGASTWNQYTDSTGIHGITHSFWNINLDECIFPKDSNRGRRYEFEGEVFYLNVSRTVQLAQVCNSQGMTCSIQFLVRWDGSSNTAFLVDEAARERGHQYYAPATSGYGKKALRAFWQCLMEELAASHAHIDNFILGNEVNMPNNWHYSGTTDPGTVTAKYASSFLDMYNVVRKFSSSARCSVCIDHSWNHDDGGIAARDFLDRFNSHVGASVDWCVSAHLYPAVLYDAEIWTEPLEGFGMTLTTNDTYSTRFVDGSNLAVMTNYIREKFGEEHRVMLTEQGFTQAQGAQSQAAALAYSYYAAMYDPMVDCFILSVENAGEVDTPLGHMAMNFELLPLANKVYSLIGSPDPADVKWIADTCLPVIGVSSWNEIVPNYGAVPEPSVDYSAVFNVDYYYNHNADIAASYGYNEKALLSHFVNFGMAEGRQASEEFNLNAYKEYNKDLVTAYGSDNKQYYMHYINFGKAEGRQAVYKAPAQDTVNVSEYAAVFDADFYRHNNSDISSIVGDSEAALFSHFLNYGMAEGRQASAEFNVGAYKEYNEDLAAIYGNDNKQYYVHYIYYGKAEGRRATYGNSTQGPVDVSEYAAVFDRDYYYHNNSDIAEGLGDDIAVLFQHFLNYGMAEGRQASAEFNVGAYKEYNEDLVSAFGNDNKQYYMHYINYGKAEGRIAVYQGPVQDTNNISEYAAVFDADYYYHNNQDIAEGVGYDIAALFDHFLNYGMAEGRQASAEFNLSVYKQYEDLAAIYGDDNKQYYMHYLHYGKAEGRIAS